MITETVVRLHGMPGTVFNASRIPPGYNYIYNKNTDIHIYIDYQSDLSYIFETQSTTITTYAIEIYIYSTSLTFVILSKLNRRL